MIPAVAGGSFSVAAAGGEGEREPLVAEQSALRPEVTPGTTRRSNQALTVLGVPKLYRPMPSTMVSAARTSPTISSVSALAAAWSGERSSGARKLA